MDLVTLQHALTPRGGTLTLTDATLPGAGLAPLLDAHNGGQPLVIGHAQADNRRDGVRVSGTAAFLGVARMALDASFTLSPAGTPVVVLGFSPDGPAPGGARWTFRTSFPDLPLFDDLRQPDGPGVSDLLGGLVPDDITFVLTNAAGTDRDTRAALVPGLNIVGHLRPAPVLGALAGPFGAQGRTLFSGLVVRPRTGQATPPLALDTYPWEAPGDAVPGIHLRADLDGDARLGPLRLAGTGLRLYTPLTTAWAAANRSYPPVIGLTTTLEVPSAALSAVVGATVTPGTDEVALGARLTGFSLNRLTQLADLVQGNDLAGLLPPAAQPAAGAGGGLSLTAVGLTLTGGVDAGSVSAVYASVGLPGATWQPVPGFSLGGLSAEFSVEQPFSRGNRFAAVTVRGTVGLGGTEIDVFAAGPDFAAGADLADDATLPLSELVSSFLPALPAPPDLTVSQLQFALSAAEGFSLTAAMADSPGWSFDLGPTGLTVESVRLDAVHRLAVAPGAPADPPGTPAPTTGAYWLQLNDEDTAPIPQAAPTGGGGGGRGRAAPTAPTAPVTPNAPAAGTDVVSGPRIVGTEGCLSGCLAIGALELDASWVLPGDLAVRADLPVVKVRDLVGWLDELGVPVPEVFDIELDDAYLVIEVGGGAASLTVGCDVPGLGLLALTAAKEGARTGLALGANLTAVRLSDLPGLSALAPVDDLLGLRRLIVVVSSLTDPGFQFPELTSLGVPALAGRGVRLPAMKGVGPGLTVYGELSAVHSGGLRAISTFLGISLDGTVAVTVSVSLPSPATNTTASLDVDVAFDAATHLTGALGVLLRSPEAGAFLAATLTTTVQDTPLTFNVTAAVFENGVLISGSMAGTVTFGPVSLTDLGLVIGLDLEGVPSFGVCGAIAAGSFASSVAVFLDSVDPTRSLLAGSVSGLSLADVAACLSGAPGNPLPVLDQIGLEPVRSFTLPAAAATALAARDVSGLAAAFTAARVPLPGTANLVHLIAADDGAHWHLTDLTTMTHYSVAAATGGEVTVSVDPQLYVAPQQTYIGALTFPQGMHVQARVDLYVVHADITIEIDAGRGIAAELQLDPVVIGPPGVFALMAADGTGGPVFSVCTYSRPRQADPRLRDPHVLVSGRLSLLGLNVASVYLDVTTSGLVAAITLSPVPLMHVTLTATVDADDLMIGGGVRVGVDTTLDLGALGSLPIDITVGGSVSGGVHAGSAALTFSGSFTFEGLSFSVGPLTLPLGATTFPGLPDTVLAAVRAAILDVLTAPVRWIGWVKDAVIQGIADATAAAQVLVQQFGRTAEQVGQLMHDAGYAADEVAAAMNAIGANATVIMRTLKDTYGMAAKDAAAAIKALGVGGTQMAAALSGVYGWTAGQTAGYLKDAYGYASDAVNTALAGAGYAAGQVSDALGSVFDDAGSALGSVGSAIEDSPVNPMNWGL